MAIQDEPVAHNELVAGGATSKHSHSGGGSTSIYYGTNTATSNLGTSLGTIPLVNIRQDSGFTNSSGEVTIGSALNGQWCEIHWMVQCTGATNRVEIRSELQVNTVNVKGSNCYTARNGTQNTGGVTGMHAMTVSTGDVIRVRALRDGSTANMISGDCSLYIRTVG